MRIDAETLSRIMAKIATSKSIDDVPADMQRHAFRSLRGVVEHGRLKGRVEGACLGGALVLIVVIVIHIILVSIGAEYGAGAIIAPAGTIVLFVIFGGFAIDHHDRKLYGETELCEAEANTVSAAESE